MPATRANARASFLKPGARRDRDLLIAWVAITAALLSGCSSSSINPELTDPIDVEALILAEQLADRSMVKEAHPDADVPSPESIERVRIIDELEWADVLAECLTRNGYPATSDFGQVGVSSVPLGQESALAVTRYVCQVQYPVRPTAPLTEAGLEELYDYLVSEQVACLEERGANVPEPPSKATFVEEFGTAGSWWPYNFVVPAGPEADWETRIECPEYPR